MQGTIQRSTAGQEQDRADSPEHGLSTDRTGKPVPANQGPVREFGPNLWFDLPFMLVILALGVSALSTADSGYSDTLYGRAAVLLFYTLGIVLNLFNRLTYILGKSTFLDAQLWRGKSVLAAMNVATDVIFAGGVLLLFTQDDNMLLIVLLAIATARPIELIAARLAPFVILTATLTGALYDIYRFLGSMHITLPTLQQVEVIVVVVVVMILGYVTRLSGKARDAEIASVLQEARTRTEYDADVLSLQVLRLNLLQSGVKAINSAIQLDDLLMMIVDNAIVVLKAEQSTIGLIDERTGDLVIRCATGIDSSQLKGRHFLPGVGVAGWVVKHGQPALIQDVKNDPRYISLDNDSFVVRSTRSMLCVPLIIEQKVIGALCVTHSLPDALTEDDQRLIISFAEQAALAVYKSQLLAELTRRQELITGLNQVTQSVLSSLDLPLVLDTIISRISELSDFDHALIYLRNERTGELQLAALGGEGPYTASLGLDEGMPALEWWQNTPQSRLFHWCSDGMLMLCMRLANNDESLGCMLLARIETRQFSGEELDAIEKLADAATIAIVKARLFSQVTTQQEQTSELYRLMLGVNGAQNRRDLAKVVSAKLQKITRAKSSALLMEDYEQGRITVWASEGQWATRDSSQLSLRSQGDPFISDALASILCTEPLGLLLIPDAPQQVKETFDCADCVTIPLSNANRIYGLLVIEPTSDPPIAEDANEMVRLAVSHSTVALERAELFESTVSSMRQSNMLYSIATRVQASLEAASVVEMTLQGALNALPLYSCELYLFEENRTRLRRCGQAIAQNVDAARASLGPETASLDANPVLIEVLRSTGLVAADIQNKTSIDTGNSDKMNGWQDAPDHNTSGTPLAPPVLLARLMRSEEALGIVRFTPTIPAEEFAHSYATFCQTLLTHTGGTLERSHLYSELLDRNREIEAVILSISNGVIVADADLNVIISNDLADRLLDLPAGKNQRESFMEIAVDTDLLQILRTCIAESKPASMDLDLKLDGESHTYEATAHPIVDADKHGVFGAVLTLRDITVERANEKAKSDFLSMISHELRTPLNSIYGFLDITLSGKTGPLSELQADFLSTAKQETTVLKRLISDLIDYSRLESRTLQMVMEPIDFSALVTRAIRSASARMKEDELSLIGNVPGDLMVVGDEVRLQQVFDNLLDNAAKFTDPGGQITVDCQADGDRIWITVKDNGCGIPPSQVESIFDRFFQADNHSSRRKRGQGLGLAICKHIIQAHDGNIWATSTQGVGTMMYIELPLFVPAWSGSRTSLPAETLPAEGLATIGHK